MQQFPPNPTSTLDSEQPSPKYPGIWIDGDIRRLAAEGTITRTEGELLGHIANYSKSGEGCWTSKKEYSRLLGVTTQWVRKMLLRLLELELIWQDGVVKHGRATKPIYQLNGDSALFKRSRGKPQLAGRGKPRFAPIKDSASQNLITSIPAGSPAANTPGKVKETEMPLLPETERVAHPRDKAPRHPPTEEHLGFARTLRDGLAKARRLGKVPRDNSPLLQKWANEFKLLAKTGHPPSEICQTVQWYAANCHDLTIPWGTSGESFRENYARIRDRMRIELAKAGPKVEISADAKRIAEEYPDLWGRQTTEQFVQLTYDNLTAYRKQLRLYIDANKGKPSADVASALREQIARNESEKWLAVAEWVRFTHAWMKQVNFGGKVTNHAFLDNPKRDAYLLKHVRQTGFSDKDYRLLKAKLEAFNAG